VAPRDGFQILPQKIPFQEKADLIESLINAGCEEIEASSFVSPKWVPQLSDAEDICKRFLHQNKCKMTYLVPNMRGALRAIESGANQIFVTTTASALHSRENLNQTIEEVLEGARQIADYAKERGVVCTATVGAAFGYSRDPEGVSKERVCRNVQILADAGFSSISLCDTSGEAHPDLVYDLCTEVLKQSDIPIGIHLHQAGGIEFANALAALQAGIRIFESSAGGLGGCPYITNAKGNIATEKLVKMFHQMGYKTGIDLEKIELCSETAKKIQSTYGTPECRQNCNRI
jgi:hydroxymethylglutaryl-CoA lyase